MKKKQSSSFPTYKKLILLVCAVSIIGGLVITIYQKMKIIDTFDKCFNDHQSQTSFMHNATVCITKEGKTFVDKSDSILSPPPIEDWREYIDETISIQFKYPELMATVTVEEYLDGKQRIINIQSNHPQYDFRVTISATKKPITNVWGVEITNPENTFSVPSYAIKLNNIDAWEAEVSVPEFTRYGARWISFFYNDKLYSINKSTGDYKTESSILAEKIVSTIKLVNK